MGPNSKKATKAEAVRMAVLAQMYCVCCTQVALHPTRIPPSEVHHIISGGKRLGHWFSLPLCAGHHRGAWTERQTQMMHPEELVSISSGRKAFEGQYGTEKGLWLKIQKDHGWSTDWPTSKVLPRRKAA